MRLKYRLLIRLLLVTIIPILIISFSIYYYTVYMMTKTTIDVLNIISNLQEKRITDIIDRNYGKIDTLAKNEIILKMPLLNGDSTQKTAQLFSTFLNQAKQLEHQYINISILDLNGKVVSSTDVRLTNNLFYNSDVYSIGKSNRYLDIDVNQDKKPVLFLASPLVKDNEIIGTIVAEVNPDELFNILSDRTGLGKTGQILLMKSDPDGNALIIFPSVSNPDSKMVISKSKINDPAIRAIYGQQSNFENLIDYKGNNVLAVTSYFPSTQWGIVVKIDSKEAFSDIKNIENMIIVSLVIMLLASVFSSLILSRMISLPITNLRLACRSITRGSLETLVINSPEPEYGELSTDINYMINELKKSETNKNEFISMISHELKTPLVAILGYCEMLSDPNLLGDLKPPQSQALSIIHNNSRKLQQLVYDLLAIQDLEMKSLKFDKKEIHVSEFMEKIRSENTLLMREKNIEFVNSTKDDIIITSDSMRIDQIFVNLIRNAVDFVPRNGRIEIGTTLDYDRVIFYVKDNGIGIPKEKQNNLFKKFYQVDTSLHRPHGGTGLGLAICKGLVEGLGGNMWFESKEGSGTSFYFSIPIWNQR